MKTKKRRRSVGPSGQLVQATGWILLLSIAAFSVVPPACRPATILPHVVEHAAIFFLAGCAFGFGYPNGFVAGFAGLSTFTLAVEITQLWIPGRHARVTDFLVDVFSVTASLVIGVMLARFRRRASTAYAGSAGA
jgi:VanZ family protein